MHLLFIVPLLLTQPDIADPDFNNDGVPGTALDTADFLSVYSEGPCSTGNCDSIDINRDTSVFDPADIDAWHSFVLWGLPATPPFCPPLSAESSLILPSPTFGQVYYVSNHGSDSNDGLSPLRPFLTPKAAYDRLPFSTDSWVCFERGSTFSDSLLLGEYHTWEKGGLSPTAPLVLTSYGDPSLPLPRFTYRHPNAPTPEDNAPSTVLLIQGDRFPGNLWVHSLAFDAPLSPRSHIAIRVYTPRPYIVIDSCTFTGGSSAATFDGVSDPSPNTLAFVFRSNTVTSTSDAGDGGHSGGLYLINCHSGLITLNRFSYCGWSGTLPHVPDDKFNQIIYSSQYGDNFQTAPLVVSYNLIEWPGHCGIQFRVGQGHLCFNTVKYAPIGISGGHAQDYANLGWWGSISHNTIVGSSAIPTASQGVSINITKAHSSYIFSNTFIDPRVPIFLEPPVGTITLSNNATLYPSPTP